MNNVTNLSMRAWGVIYLLLLLLLFVFVFVLFFIAVILNCALSSGKVWNWVSTAGRGLKMRWVGRVSGLWEKSANSENSGKIISERLRRFSVPDFAPASQNLWPLRKQHTLRWSIKSVFIGNNTVDCESTVCWEISAIDFIRHLLKWYTTLDPG